MFQLVNPGFHRNEFKSGLYFHLLWVLSLKLFITGGKFCIVGGDVWGIYGFDGFVFVCAFCGEMQSDFFLLQILFLSLLALLNEIEVFPKHVQKVFSANFDEIW